MDGYAESSKYPKFGHFLWESRRSYVKMGDLGYQILRKMLDVYLVSTRYVQAKSKRDDVEMNNYLAKSFIAGL